jgi:hypothetical protein
MHGAVAFYGIVRTLTPVVLPLGLFVGLRKGKSTALEARDFRYSIHCGEISSRGLCELVREFYVNFTFHSCRPVSSTL